MFLFTMIGTFIALCISAFISVLISQPFTGAVIRLRANYLPKAVSLDNILEDGAMEGGGSDGFGGTSGVTPRKISAYWLNRGRQTAKIGPVVSGVFPMLFRTKRLEGWSGVYKGSFAQGVQLVLLTSTTLLFFSVDRYATAGGGYRAAPTGPGQFGFFGNLFFMIMVAVVSLPGEVITSRIIVHPRTLPFSLKHLRTNLAEVLSPAELAQPWRIYLIPGLLPAAFLHVAWIGLLTRLVRHILVPNLGGLAEPTPAQPGDVDYSGPSSSSVEVNPLALIIYLCWLALSVVVLSPLEVVSVKLATQRPERQQPLHLAYARASGNGNGPASYSHQSSVPSTTASQPDSLKDNAKPLPKEPTESAQQEGGDSQEEAPGRPSFAIEDEDEEVSSPPATARAEDRRPLMGASAQPTSNERPRGLDADPSTPTPRSLPSQQQQQHHSTPSSYEEPPEPVIALRPVEEPRNSEEADGGAEVVQRYEGWRDCLDKIIEEEGVEAFYRGAWVTGLGALVGGF